MGARQFAQFPAASVSAFERPAENFKGLQALMRSCAWSQKALEIPFL